MKMKKVIVISLIALLLPMFSSAQGIDPNFDPSRILEDNDILNSNGMTMPEVQHFLQSKNSFLANYITPNSNGMMKTAAEIIYDAAKNNYNCDGITLSDKPTEAEKKLKCRPLQTVNPKFLLVLLQKEASLVENTNPSQARLDWATGYGCPDNWACNPYYKGFGKQVNSAALQFLAYMKEPNRYNFKMGGTYTFTNPFGTISKAPLTVTPQNQATAALYNYTPHVFNGNYNVYKLWDRYFPEGTEIKVSYPDGSILKAKDSPVVWLIQNSKKRPFLNWSSFISRFRPNQIIEVDASELAGYAEDTTIKFANYSLAKTPQEKIYLIVDNEKRPFTDLATFQKFGFNPMELEFATETDLGGYILGQAITATSTHLTGALIQDAISGGVYYVENGTKAPIIDRVFLQTKFKDQAVTKEKNGELSAYTKIGPVVFDDGELVKSTISPTVYLVSNGQKRPFADESALERLGYSKNNIIEVSPKVLYHYNQGEIIK